jgi:hypothetical protein
LLPSIATRGLLEQAQSPTQQNELAARIADRLAVVLAEIRDRLEVGINRPVSQINSTLR